MYQLKDDLDLKKYSQTKLAEIVGLNRETVNRIFNRKQLCSKLVAYCMTKYFDSKKEIEYFFVRVEV